MHSQTTDQTGGLSGFLRSPTGITLIVFLTIAIFYLVTEHTAHVFGILPYGLLLLCPLMHLFMHGSHGGHGGGNNHSAHSDHAGHQHDQGEQQ